MSVKVGDKFIIEIGDIKTLLGTDDRICEINDIGWLIKESVLDRLKKHEDNSDVLPEDEEFRVGDEVEGCLGVWIVTSVLRNDDGNILSGIDSCGFTHKDRDYNLTKTGRRSDSFSNAILSLKDGSAF